jgi:hypothetical protein
MRPNWMLALCVHVCEPLFCAQQFLSDLNACAPHPTRLSNEKSLWRWKIAGFSCLHAKQCRGPFVKNASHNAGKMSIDQCVSTKKNFKRALGYVVSIILTVHILRGCWLSRLSLNFNVRTNTFSVTLPPQYIPLPPLSSFYQQKDTNINTIIWEFYRRISSRWKDSLQ